VIRPARPSDLDDVHAVQHSSPSPEFLALAGTSRDATMLGHALCSLRWLTETSAPVVVAVEDGTVVGMMKYVLPGNAPGSMTAREGFDVAAALRLRLVTLPLKLMGQRAVALPRPPEALHILELHTHPQRRRSGIASDLLNWSAGLAEDLSIRVRSLDTRLGNPAVQLYLRHGFRVVAEARSRRYERHFGSAGRVLMVDDGGRG
jgi:ribosomal protein S18 acetylase RimI-like enzyme